MKIPKRRRKQGKTDYLKRIKLLKGNKPRIVFRKTNKYILVQYVDSEAAKDKVILGITSKHLLEYGWPNDFSRSLKSIPATYLTGFLLGKKIQSKKLRNPIIDSGMIRTITKSKFFAFLKGLKDSGIEIECKDKNFPEQERIEGKNLKNPLGNEFEKIKSNINKK